MSAEAQALIPLAVVPVRAIAVRHRGVAISVVRCICGPIAPNFVSLSVSRSHPTFNQPIS